MKEVNRRGFLLYSGLGLIVLACGHEPVKISQQIERPRTLPDFPEINLDYIQDRAKIVAQDFADYFKIEVDSEKIAGETDLIIDTEGYKNANDAFGESHRAGEGIKIPFLNVDRRTESPKRIFINGLAVAEMVNKLNGSYNQEVETDVTDAFLSLALADYLSSERYSKDFDEAVFGEFLHVNGPQVDSLGRDVYVDGASLKYDYQGRKISMFESLERLEQIIIASSVYNSRPRNTKIDFNNFGIGDTQVQEKLLINLFERINPDQDPTLLTEELFRIRGTEGAREDLFKKVQELGGKGYGRITIFGIAVFGAIAAGGIDQFNLLMGVTSKNLN